MRKMSHPPPALDHIMPRRRRSGVVHAGQDAKLVTISITPLRDAKPLIVQRTREERIRGVRTGGAHDHKVDCPSPSMPLVYALPGFGEVSGGSRGRGGRACRLPAVSHKRATKRGGRM